MISGEPGTSIGWTDAWRIDVEGTTLWLTYGNAVTLHEVLGDIITAYRKRERLNPDGTTAEHKKSEPESEKAPKVDPTGTVGCSTERRPSYHVDTPINDRAQFGFHGR